MIKSCISTFRMEKWFDGDIRPVFDMIELAERKGVDVVSVSDHVLMAPGDLHLYPYNKTLSSTPASAEQDRQAAMLPQFEAIAMLSAIAARTRRITLSSSVLLATLRSPALLAKQLATLDAISGGRVALAIGVGWQKSEYLACGIPFEGRFGRMIDLVRACRALWLGEETTFDGMGYRLDGVICQPAPRSPSGIQLSFGIAPSPRNIERIAEWSDGWHPLGLSHDELKRAVDQIHAARARLGRMKDPFRVAMQLTPAYVDGKRDLDATLRQIPDLVAAGVTCVTIMPAVFVRTPEAFEPFLDTFVAAIRAAG